jgi:hypothetical protein
MKSVRSVEIMTAVNWHEGRRELALELFLLSRTNSDSCIENWL